MRKGWKWALIVVVLALVVYKVKFGPVPVSTEPVAAGEVVAEVMGTGTLEAHYQATVSAKIQGSLSNFWWIKMIGLKVASSWRDLMTPISRGK